MDNARNNKTMAVSLEKSLKNTNKKFSKTYHTWQTHHIINVVIQAPVMHIGRRSKSSVCNFKKLWKNIFGESLQAL